MPPCIIDEPVKTTPHQVEREGTRVGSTRGLPNLKVLSPTVVNNDQRRGAKRIDERKRHMEERFK